MCTFRYDVLLLECFDRGTLSPPATAEVQKSETAIDHYFCNGSGSGVTGGGRYTHPPPGNPIPKTTPTPSAPPPATTPPTTTTTMPPPATATPPPPPTPTTT